MSAAPIIGIGTDLVNIERIEKSLTKWDEQFISRLFTKEERALCDGRKNRAACYAKRFAAKEACAKALGTGVAQDIKWTEMSVALDAAGAPHMTLIGSAAKRLAMLAGAGATAKIDLSLSDEPPFALAFVVISYTALGKQTDE